MKSRVGGLYPLMWHQTMTQHVGDYRVCVMLPPDNGRASPAAGGDSTCLGVEVHNPLTAISSLYSAASSMKFREQFCYAMKARARAGAGFLYIWDQYPHFHMVRRRLHWRRVPHLTATRRFLAGQRRSISLSSRQPSGRCMPTDGSRLRSTSDWPTVNSHGPMAARSRRSCCAASTSASLAPTKHTV